MPPSDEQLEESYLARENNQIIKNVYGVDPNQIYQNPTPYMTYPYEKVENQEPLQYDYIIPPEIIEPI